VNGISEYPTFFFYPKGDIMSRKCDSCMMAVTACPALKKEIDPKLFATREELCEINYEDKNIEVV